MVALRRVPRNGGCCGGTALQLSVWRRTLAHRPRRARGALPLRASGGAFPPTAASPARLPPFRSAAPPAQKDEENYKISPWIIGCFLFLLVGGSVVQMLSMNKLVG